MTVPDSPKLLAVEIGGTKLQAAIGDGDGRIAVTRRTAAMPEAGRRGILAQLETLIAEILLDAGSPPTACGIGFGGPIDARRGVVLKSHQVADWDEFPLVAWFEKRFQMPAMLGNDSDLAALAEANLGAGKGFSPVVYMNIGSGIGGGIVIGGKLYEGQGVGAAEIGHMRVVPALLGQPWPTLESVCSGWALAKAATTVVGSSIAAPSAADLASAAAAGNPSAKRIWDEAIERVGVAIANVVALLHPQRFVIGGGVSNLGEILMLPLRQAYARQAFEPFRDSCELVPAALGEAVVLHGSLLLANAAWSSQMAREQCHD